MSARPRALIIGAGALGLGFLAERMAGDYDISLADVPARLPFLEELARRGGFAVTLCGPQGMTVRQVRGSFRAGAVGGPWFSEALRAADLALTAVGTRALPDVVSAVSRELGARRGRMWVLFCENGRSVAARYGKGLTSPVTPVDTVMSRMCRVAEDGETRYAPLWPGSQLRLVVESFAEIPLYGEPCRGGPFSRVFRMLGAADFALEEDMKLFLHNGLHAFVSYHAFLQGAHRFTQVAPPLWEEARRVAEEELVPALLFHHPQAAREALSRRAADLLARFANPWFDDVIRRGVRGAAEKLAPGERLLGGVDYIREAGIEPRGYARTVEAAFRIAALQEESWAGTG